MTFKSWFRGWLVVGLLAVGGCQDESGPTGPSAPEPTASVMSTGPASAATLFARSSPEVLALPGTVFAGRDASGERLVFGVERRAVIPEVERVLRRLGTPESSYVVRVVEPIRFLTSLRDEHESALGGVQIHFSNYLCTLGFSVDHAGGRSFVTNSHCTDNQGENSGTVYYQPTSSINPSPIGVEAHDPSYSKNLPGCSRGKQCRYSDAARVLYESGVESLGEIAKTTGENDGSLTVSGSFDIGSQDNGTMEFSGTFHKVGRTTGWTSGEADLSCANVNVSGSNIQLLCQTMVVRPEGGIAAGGDSGSPVFRTTGSSSAELVGILWGGSSSGDRFVFSPLKNVQDELGGLNATTDGVGGGDDGSDGGDGDGGDGGDDDGASGRQCPPGNPNHPNCG